MRKYVFTAILAICLFAASSVFAHSLHVFAWLDNGQIIVEGSFGKNRPAQNASVAVYDTIDHAQILTGATNEQGRFTFSVPQVVRLGHPLTIQVNAGQGHLGQWLLNPQELYAAASLAAGFETADIANKSATPAAALPSPPSAVPTEQLQSIIQRELEVQLSPIRQHLAAQTVSGPTLVEIIGGLGWIMGLVGLGLYFKARKNSKDK